jgi:hypothetical protein
MSKKRQNQQLVLSIATIFIITTITTLFYFIDQSIDKEEISLSTFKVIEDNISHKKDDFSLDELEKAYKSEVNNDNYLSEIKDLHDSLEEEKNSSENIYGEPLSLLPDVRIPEQNIRSNVDSNLPKLVIIIDDVALKHQVKKLKKLNLALTLSFFPSDLNHPQTTEFALETPFSMVHFPLEAQNFKNEEVDTLHVGDSENRIRERVNQISSQFHNLHFVNNHTGSKFTSDYKSMKFLLKALAEHNIQFVDSVTTSKSVVKAVSKELGLRYIRRDIFIDNKLDVDYILNQLKTAIELAKKRGYAVAIGHPHNATIKALSKLRPLLDGVQLVYINEI